MSGLKQVFWSLKKNPIQDLSSNHSTNNSARPLTTLSNHTHLQPTLNLTQPLVLRENDALRLARQIGHLPLVDLRLRRRPLLLRRDPIQELRPVQTRHVLAARGGGQAFVRIKVTLLINHYNKNKLANYFQNFNSACRFLMITYYCFYVLFICYNS